jgi:enoyl-CoA hydratase/carnithine racemase
MQSGGINEVAPVRFEEVEARGGRRIGFAHLARARQMNALSLEMCEAILRQLSVWASDESITCVVLDGDGERGFCAGGDVVTAVRGMRAGGPQRFVYADMLFAAEYRLVHAVFDFPKPFLSWMHGVTMGAGLGLGVAASHRIAVPSLQWAMPESRIGLFPDVGATWFLGRAPDNAGPFVALTGRILGAADAMHLGIADWSVAADHQQALHAALADAEIATEPRVAHAQIATLIGEHHDRSAGEGGGELRPRHAVLRAIGQTRDVHAFREKLTEAAASDPWFADALANLEAASPTSICVGFEHFGRGRGRSFAETLAVDLVLAKAFVRGHDFSEGVRAALIDRDRRPQWSPASLDEVSTAMVERYFT